MLELDIQRVSTAAQPSSEHLQAWCETALQQQQETEITIRIVDEDESQQFNTQYRGKKKPTNILSFPFEKPALVETPLLGDLLVCAPLVADEAQQQGKSPEAHWAHIVIHGILHLQGYDHETADDAAVMEALEVKLLAQLGFADPYSAR